MMNMVIQLIAACPKRLGRITMRWPPSVADQSGVFRRRARGAQLALNEKKRVIRAEPPRQLKYGLIEEQKRPQKRARKWICLIGI